MSSSNNTRRLATALAAVAAAAGTVTVAAPSPAHAEGCYIEHYLTNDTTGVYATRSLRDGRYVLSDLIKTKGRAREVTRLNVFYKDPVHLKVAVGAGFTEHAWMRTEKLDFWYRTAC